MELNIDNQSKSLADSIVILSVIVLRSWQASFIFSGEVKRTTDCIYWLIGLDSFNQAQKYQAFGVQVKNSDLVSIL